MKKCPYCAELIQNEAIVCRFCGRELNKSALKAYSETKEPSAAASIIFAIVMLVVIYGIAYFIGVSWTGPISDLENMLVVYQLGTMLGVTTLALSGLDPEKKGVLRFIGTFILSVIPIAGWIVIYWAGKGLARLLQNR